MNFLENIIVRAKENKKTIILPEGDDPRVLEAASIITKQGFADIVILGKAARLEKKAKGIDLSGIRIIDHLENEKFETYAHAFYELRKKKGMTPEKAREILKHPLYFGAMMVKSDDVDGMVAGASNSSADTIRCALQTVKTAPDVEIFTTSTPIVVSNKFYGENGFCIFTDTAMFELPNSDELAQIAISAARFFKLMMRVDAKVAFLSYSTYGSGKSERITTVEEALLKARSRAPEIMLDGELQFDAAVIPEVSDLKANGSPIGGRANVFVFPELNSANIGCKIAERFGNAKLYGAVSQGLAKPINDLSRGCCADDIVGMAAITAIQAQEIEENK